MPRNELRGDKASYSLSHNAVLVVCRLIIIVLRGRSLRKRLLLCARTNYYCYEGKRLLVRGMNDYWFVLGTTTALRGNDYCCSLVPRSFRFTYSRLFGVKQYRVPAVSTLERLSCLTLKVESQRWMENEPVLVDDLTSTGQLANQYRYI